MLPAPIKGIMLEQEAAWEVMKPSLEKIEDAIKAAAYFGCDSEDKCSSSCVKTLRCVYYPRIVEYWMGYVVSN